MIRKPQFKLSWKYALGEIVLIFIGISLAITFQNWNEDRRKTQLETVYLEELLEDCKRDSIILDQFILLSEGKYQDGLTTYKAIQTKTIEKDTAYFIARLFFTGRYLEYQPYFPTYEELISTGNLNIIANKELKDKIRKFIQNSKVDQTFWAAEFRARKQKYNNHLHKYFDADIMPMLWLLPINEQGFKEITKENLIDAYRTDLKGFLSDPMSLLIVESCKGVDRELSNTYKRDLESLSEIMDIIKAQLK